MSEDTIACSSCHATVAANLKFCSSCGELMPLATSGDRAPAKWCRSCGSALSGDPKICNNCTSPTNVPPASYKSLSSETLPTNPTTSQIEETVTLALSLPTSYTETTADKLRPTLSQLKKTTLNPCKKGCGGVVAPDIKCCPTCGASQDCASANTKTKPQSQQSAPVSPRTSPKSGQATTTTTTPLTTTTTATAPNGKDQPTPKLTTSGDTSAKKPPPKKPAKPQPKPPQKPNGSGPRKTDCEDMNPQAHGVDVNLNKSSK